MSAPNSQGATDAKNGNDMAPQGSMSAAEYQNYQNDYNNNKK